MARDVARVISEAYRWDRRLGSTVIETGHCHIVTNPGLASEPAKQLYARLGFRPIMLSRTWVREVPAGARYWSIV